MSDEIEIVIDSNETTIESELIVDVISNNNIVDIESSEPELEVTFKKQEYVIAGDDMYIPLSYDEAPQWLKDTITNITDLSLTQKITELNSLTSTLNGLINELNIAKNTYTMSIIDSAEIDERINARIETLNSSIADSQANIVDLISTKATPDQASSLALNVLTSSINSGAIGSLVSNLQTTISDNTSTLANNIDIVHSEMSGEFEATSDVIDTIQTYVGIDGAGASTNTGLSAYLQGADGTIGSADSKVANNVYVDSNGVTRSKFEYNSSLKVGGTVYSSGFGLATSFTDASIPIGDSQFWINASKLKFTNSNKTGAVAPFTIDASGTIPKITFNGNVTFGSGQSGTIDQAIAAVVETVSVGDKNINITDNIIPITSLVADTDNSGYQFIGTPTKSIQVGIDTYAEAQIVLDGTDEVYSPYISDVTVPYYYRFGIKNITNLDRFKIVTINSSNVITYNNITITINSGQTLSSTEWYIIDGIINPVGGDTSASGSIRTKSGTKVGTINNFAIASGSTKILLGWISICTISRMKACKITADTITSDLTTVNSQLITLQTNIDSSNSLLADIANDNKLTPDEKINTKKEFDIIVSEKSKNVTQANTYGVSVVAYNSAYDTLNTYITPLLSNLTTTNDIVGSTFRNMFKLYYDANVDLLNAISTKIKNDLTYSINGIPNSSNLLYNSAPKIGSETKGWHTWNNSGMTVNLSAGWDIWKPTGGASVAVNIGGSPAINSLFDATQSLKIPVMAGERYEASAYISAHRTNSCVSLSFYDSNSTYISEYGGNTINFSGSSALTNWGRSVLFVTAPANSAYALFFVRSIVTGVNPYCFVSYAYAGKATANQTIPSSWSEGTSAGATYTSELSNDAGFVLPSGVANAINTNTTTIHGSKVTTGSIAAAQIAAGTITADKISTYNLTAANATFENSIITNAKIADASITNAKIADASITNAKITDASITNAKIANLSVDTLKIQDEAIIVPRYASGNGSISMMYTPAVTHTVYFMIAVPVTNGNFRIRFYVNGNNTYNFSSTLSFSYAGNIPITVNAGITYTFTCTAVDSNGSPLFTQLLMLGIKK